MKRSSLEALVEDARRRGLVTSERRCGPLSFAPPMAMLDAGEPEPKAILLPSVHVPPNVWLVGVETRSESNGRDWRKRSGRTQKARRAVSLLFGKTLVALAPFAEHFHNGGTLRIVFTRLAPCKLDRGNVSTSMKGVEDGVAWMLGADDGDSRWLASYEQENSDRYGVRVELARE